ncbi:MAG: phosphoribosylaminoimidazolesuccinocarboxamide synthase [Caldilineaceae bacterium]|nr:phosphoribosylaminoimidazolesuccinocarboxamide synthase [Caldilineaceae bacterium]MCB0141593.1 phosphoribosylaminoimidazolesuccinocarboxamide synthase [Caldilineaceae bacterium]
MDSQTLSSVDLPFLGTKSSGKVRDIYRVDDKLVLITTDRLSAFDRILGLVPWKGQVLNQLSAFWFSQLADIIGSHFVEAPDPNVTVAQVCTPLPVEVVVRGYITGVTSTALWYRYSQGERNIYGIDFPDGLQKNDALSTPIITPTTKASDGGHDERITNAQVVSLGLVEAALWRRVSEVAVAIFQRGQEIARRAGLILVDTKYEFGLTPNGDLVLIDEVHTPDSSRFWIADTYAARKTAGQEPENFDKEYVRLYYAAQGYRGDGDPMPLPVDLANELSQRYIRTYEMLTGRAFERGETPVAARIARNLEEWRSRGVEE